MVATTNHGAMCEPLDDIGLEDCILEAGGLARKLRVFRLPEDTAARSMTASVAVLLAFAMVAIGAILQLTTGVGLGLIAGPFLLFVMDPASAILRAIVLNLLLSVILLPWEWRQIEFAPLARLTGWAAIGIPLGSADVFRIGTSF